MPNFLIIQSTTKHQRIPKRVLHFSDGDLIEYSDDEVDATKTLPATALIDFVSIHAIVKKYCRFL